MAQIVFNGPRKITFTAAADGLGSIKWSLKVENGTQTATRVSTGPIELWIGSTLLQTSYSGTYTGCADSAYNSYNHSVNFQSGNSSSAKFPAVNGEISGSVTASASSVAMKMYVDYCYSNQKWTGTATINNAKSTDTYINVNSGRYCEFMAKNPLTFPTWSETNGQDDIAWVGTGGGSWSRGGITYPYGAGHTQSSSASLDDVWNTHLYAETWGLGSCQYYPRIYVKYNANGGSSTPSTQTKYIGNTLTLASAISRSHYTFAGWAAGSASGTKYSAGQKIAEMAWNSLYNTYSGNNGWNTTVTHSGNNITLYATWTANKYKVSYNANGGSSTPTAQTVTYPNSCTLASAIKRNNGAVSGYSVTYNANGGSGAPGAQTSGNRTVTYTFSKWAAGSTSGTKYSAGATYQPTANVTMYATWSSSTSANSSWTCSSTKPTRSGYTFLGWSTSSTATSATYTAGSAYTIKSALTLYAVWKVDQASVRYKNSGAWSKGKAYYKKDGTWVKVQKVYIKVDGTWKLANDY